MAFIKQQPNFECYNMFRRCVLVIFWQNQNVVFRLSVTFSPLSFLVPGKPKCFHLSNLKLDGASAVSQTLYFSSHLSFAVTTTFALQLDLYKQGKHKG